MPTGSIAASATIPLPRHICRPQEPADLPCSGSLCRRAQQECRAWGHPHVLYLTLRRGLLMLEAQMVWLDEMEGYLKTGRLRRK